MAGRFGVDLEMLQDAVDRMSSFGGRLDERFEEAQRRVDRLHQEWSGDAATEHLEAHRSWVAGAREMRAAIASLHQIAARAQQNYLAAVAANRRMWP
jgi:WXG100 family type VII secretion target